VPHRDIAAGLGVARSTLARYFGPELVQGAARCRLAVVLAMFAAARRGRTSAARAYLRRSSS
jgi:hypothetical protein